MFDALRYRSYRLYWFGILVSSIGTWVQNTARGWLVLELTNSALMLGTVSFLSSLPMTFLTLLAGVLADRVDRRKLLLSTQTVLMMAAFLLGFLTSSGLVAVWHVMSLALAAGVATAFDIPVRHSVVPTLVGKRHIMNAIALSSSAFNTARIVGPMLAGILVLRIGLGKCFYVNSASFLAFIIAISLIEIKSFREAGDQATIWSDFRLGLRYAWSHSTVRMLVGMAAVPSMFAMPYITLMPIFAKDVLDVGVQGLGMLMSATGVGGLCGALTLALLSRSQRKGRILTAASLLFPVMLLGFANSRSFGLSAGFLVGVGFMNLTFLASINTLIQSIVPDDLRGRVISTYMFAFLGLAPFGHLLMGAAANSLGGPVAVTGGALVCAVFALAVLVRQPEIRRFQ